MKVLLTGGHEEHCYDMRAVLNYLGHEIFEPGLYGSSETDPTAYKRPFNSSTTEDEHHHHNKIFHTVEGEGGWFDTYGHDRLKCFTNSPRVDEYVYDRCPESVDYIAAQADVAYGFCAQYVGVFAPHMPFACHFNGQMNMRYYKAIEWVRRHGGMVISYCEEESDLFPAYDVPVIHFPKDPAAFGTWTGDLDKIMYVANAMAKRGNSCHYNEFKATARPGQWTLGGKENEDVGSTVMSFVDYNRALSNSRAFFNLGTVPAPYTLSIIEAAMTGMPVLTPDYDHPADCAKYAVPRLFEGACVHGSISKLNKTIGKWLDNGKRARKEMQRLSRKSLEVAMREFNIHSIAPKWGAVFEELRAVA